MKISLLFLCLASVGFTESSLDMLDDPGNCTISTKWFDVDETTPLGFSGQDFINQMGESRDVIFTYANKLEPSRGKLTLKSISPKIQYIDFKTIDPSRPCLHMDLLHVDFVIGLISEDGSFNESFEETFATEQNGIHSARAFFGMAPWDLKGNFYRNGKFSGVDVLIAEMMISKDDFSGILAFHDSKGFLDIETAVSIRAVKP